MENQAWSDTHLKLIHSLIGLFIQTFEHWLINGISSIFYILSMNIYSLKIFYFINSFAVNFLFS